MHRHQVSIEHTSTLDQVSSVEAVDEHYRHLWQQLSLSQPLAPYELAQFYYTVAECWWRTIDADSLHLCLFYLEKMRDTLWSSGKQPPFDWFCQGLEWLEIAKSQFRQHRQAKKRAILSLKGIKDKGPDQHTIAEVIEHALALGDPATAERYLPYYEGSSQQIFKERLDWLRAVIKLKSAQIALLELPETHILLVTAGRAQECFEKNVEGQFLIVLPDLENVDILNVEPTILICRGEKPMPDQKQTQTVWEIPILLSSRLGGWLATVDLSSVTLSKDQWLEGLFAADVFRELPIEVREALASRQQRAIGILRKLEQAYQDLGHPLLKRYYHRQIRTTQHYIQENPLVKAVSLTAKIDKSLIIDFPSPRAAVPIIGNTTAIERARFPAPQVLVSLIPQWRDIHGLQLRFNDPMFFAEKQSNIGLIPPEWDVSQLPCYSVSNASKGLLLKRAMRTYLQTGMHERPWVAIVHVDKQYYVTLCIVPMPASSDENAAQACIYIIDSHGSMEEQKSDNQHRVLALLSPLKTQQERDWTLTYKTVPCPSQRAKSEDSLLHAVMNGLAVYYVWNSGGQDKADFWRFFENHLVNQAVSNIPNIAQLKTWLANRESALKKNQDDQKAQDTLVEVEMDLAVQESLGIWVEENANLNFSNKDELLSALEKTGMSSDMLEQLKKDEARLESFLQQAREKAEENIENQNQALEAALNTLRIQLLTDMAAQLTHEKTVLERNNLDYGSGMQPFLVMMLASVMAESKEKAATARIQGLVAAYRDSMKEGPPELIQGAIDNINSEVDVLDDAVRQFRQKCFTEYLEMFSKDIEDVLPVAKEFQITRCYGVFRLALSRLIVALYKEKHTYPLKADYNKPMLALLLYLAGLSIRPNKKHQEATLTELKRLITQYRGEVTVENLQLLWDVLFTGITHLETSLEFYEDYKSWIDREWQGIRENLMDLAKSEYELDFVRKAERFVNFLQNTMVAMFQTVQDAPLEKGLDGNSLLAEALRKDLSNSTASLESFKALFKQIECYLAEHVEPFAKLPQISKLEEAMQQLQEVFYIGDLILLKSLENRFAENWNMLFDNVIYSISNKEQTLRIARHVERWLANAHYFFLYHVRHAATVQDIEHAAYPASDLLNPWAEKTELSTDELRALVSNLTALAPYQADASSQVEVLALSSQALSKCLKDTWLETNDESNCFLSKMSKTLLSFTKACQAIESVLKARFFKHFRELLQKVWNPLDQENLKTCVAKTIEMPLKQPTTNLSNIIWCLESLAKELPSDLQLKSLAEKLPPDLQKAINVFKQVNEDNREDARLLQSLSANFALTLLDVADDELTQLEKYRTEAQTAMEMFYCDLHHYFLEVSKPLIQHEKGINQAWVSISGQVANKLAQAAQQSYPQQAQKYIKVIKLLTSTQEAKSVYNSRQILEEKLKALSPYNHCSYIKQRMIELSNLCRRFAFVARELNDFVPLFGECLRIAYEDLPEETVFGPLGLANGVLGALQKQGNTNDILVMMGRISAGQLSAQLVNKLHRIEQCLQAYDQKAQADISQFLRDTIKETIDHYTASLLSFRQHATELFLAFEKTLHRVVTTYDVLNDVNVSNNLREISQVHLPSSAKLQQAWYLETLNTLEKLLKNKADPEFLRLLIKLQKALSSEVHHHHTYISSKAKNLKILLSSIHQFNVKRVNRQAGNTRYQQITITAGATCLSRIVHQIGQSFSPGDEISIIAADCLYLDRDLTDDGFSGVNISIVGPRLEVPVSKNSFRIKTDGKDTVMNWPTPAPAEGYDSDGDGNSGYCGEGGLPGQSAGNVNLVGNALKMIEVFANGGKGSNGQNGSNGAKGRNGEKGSTINESELKSKLKDRFNIDCRFKQNVNITAVVTTQGKAGTLGGAGGMLGMGGEGGKGGSAGAINVESLTAAPKVMPKKDKGASGNFGSNGERDGEMGDDGKDGLSAVLRVRAAKKNDVLNDREGWYKYGYHYENLRAEIGLERYQISTEYGIYYGHKYFAWFDGSDPIGLYFNENVLPSSSRDRELEKQQRQQRRQEKQAKQFRRQGRPAEKIHGIDQAMVYQQAQQHFNAFMNPNNKDTYQHWLAPTLQQFTNLWGQTLNKAPTQQSLPDEGLESQKMAHLASGFRQLSQAHQQRLANSYLDTSNLSTGMQTLSHQVAHQFSQMRDAIGEHRAHLNAAVNALDLESLRNGFRAYGAEIVAPTDVKEWVLKAQLNAPTEWTADQLLARLSTLEQTMQQHVDRVMQEQIQRQARLARQHEKTRQTEVLLDRKSTPDKKAIGSSYDNFQLVVDKVDEKPVTKTSPPKLPNNFLQESRLLENIIATFLSESKHPGLRSFARTMNVQLQSWATHLERITKPKSLPRVVRWAAQMLAVMNYQFDTSGFKLSEKSFKQVFQCLWCLSTTPHALKPKPEQFSHIPQEDWLAYLLRKLLCVTLLEQCKFKFLPEQLDQDLSNIPEVLLQLLYNKIVTEYRDQLYMEVKLLPSYRVLTQRTLEELIKDLNQLAVQPAWLTQFRVAEQLAGLPLLQWHERFLEMRSSAKITELLIAHGRSPHDELTQKELKLLTQIKERYKREEAFVQFCVHWVKISENDHFKDQQARNNWLALLCRHSLGPEQIESVIGELEKEKDPTKQAELIKEHSKVKHDDDRSITDVIAWMNNYHVGSVATHDQKIKTYLGSIEEMGTAIWGRVLKLKADRPEADEKSFKILQKFLKDLDNNTDYRRDRRIYVKKHRDEIVAYLIYAWWLDKRETVREVQLVALLLMIFSEDHALLEQVKTGEGKTLIVGVIAAYQALCGYRVDIVSSNRDLASDGQKKCASFFQCLNISSAHNCESEEAARVDGYKATIVYGDVGIFQGDLLDSECNNKGIVGQRYSHQDQVYLILDEVDSMFLDKARNVLYLSHSMDCLKWLESLFIQIWAIVLGEKIPDGDLLDARISTICTHIRNVITSDQMMVPSYLHNFVSRKLPYWVRSAFEARVLKPNVDFVLDVAPQVGQQRKLREVIIVDKDTGTEQYSSRWSNGLAQFLELRFQRKLSVESLKAIFMSNISFFQRYGHRVYGLTGTLGTAQSQQFLAQMYAPAQKYEPMEFAIVPPAKEKPYHRKCSKVATTPEMWFTLIVQATMKHMKKQPILIITENVDDVDKLEQYLKSEGVADHCIHRYALNGDNIEHFFEKNPAKPGDIVLATNKGGRGTDIKLDKSVNLTYGLHVILTYMPSNLRIEEQAFGRACRNGAPGSGQFIVLVDVSYKDQYGIRSESVEEQQNKLNEYAEDIIIEEKRRRDEIDSKFISELGQNGILPVQIDKELFDEFKKLRDRLINARNSKVQNLLYHRTSVYAKSMRGAYEQLPNDSTLRAKLKPHFEPFVEASNPYLRDAITSLLKSADKTEAGFVAFEKAKTDFDKSEYQRAKGKQAPKKGSMAEKYAIAKPIYDWINQVIQDQWAFWLDEQQADTQAANSVVDQDIILKKFKSSFAVEIDNSFSTITANDLKSLLDISCYPEQQIQLAQIAREFEVYDLMEAGFKKAKDSDFEKAKDSDPTGFAWLGYAASLVQTQMGKTEQKKNVRRALKEAQRKLNTMKLSLMANQVCAGKLAQQAAGDSDLTRWVSPQDNYYVEQVKGKLEVITLHLAMINKAVGSYLSAQDFSFVDPSDEPQDHIQNPAIQKPSQKIFSALIDQGILRGLSLRHHFSKTNKNKETLQELLKQVLCPSVADPLIEYLENLPEKGVIEDVKLEEMVCCASELWESLQLGGEEPPVWILKNTPELPLDYEQTLMSIEGLNELNVDIKLFDQNAASRKLRSYLEANDLLVEVRRVRVNDFATRIKEMRLSQSLNEKYSKVRFNKPDGGGIGDLFDSLEDLQAWKESSLARREASGEEISIDEKEYFYEHHMPFGTIKEEVAKLKALLYDKHIVKSGGWGLTLYQKKCHDDDNHYTEELKEAIKKEVEQFLGKDAQLDQIIEVILQTQGRLRGFRDGAKGALLSFFELTPENTGLSADDLKQIPGELSFYATLGFNRFFVIEEDKCFHFSWGAFVVFLIGIAQVVLGAVLNSFGLFNIGNALISEGISDMVYAVMAQIQGNFSWKDWAVQKSISFTMALLSAGIDTLKNLGKVSQQLGNLSRGQLIGKLITKAMVKFSVEMAKKLAMNLVMDQLIKGVVHEALTKLAHYFRVELLEKLVQSPLEWCLAFDYFINQKGHEEFYKTLENKIHAFFKQNQTQIRTLRQQATSQFGNVLQQVIAVLKGLGGIIGQLGQAAQIADQAQKIIKVLESLDSLVNFFNDLTKLFNAKEREEINGKVKTEAQHLLDVVEKDSVLYIQGHLERFIRNSLEKLIGAIESKVEIPSVESNVVTRGSSSATDVPWKTKVSGSDFLPDSTKDFMDNIVTPIAAHALSKMIKETITYLLSQVDGFLDPLLTNIFKSLEAPLAYLCMIDAAVDTYADQLTSFIQFFEKLENGIINVVGGVNVDFNFKDSDKLTKIQASALGQVTSSLSSLGSIQFAGLPNLSNVNLSSLDSRFRQAISQSKTEWTLLLKRFIRSQLQYQLQRLSHDALGLPPPDEQPVNLVEQLKQRLNRTRQTIQGIHTQSSQVKKPPKVSVNMHASMFWQNHGRMPGIGSFNQQGNNFSL